MKTRIHPIATILLLVSLVIQSYTGSAQTGIQGGQHNPNSTVVTTIMSTYPYPSSISTDGTYVVGMPFGGGASYFWSMATGVISITGEANGVSDGGIAGGVYSNPSVLYNGSNVQTAEIQAQETC